MIRRTFAIALALAAALAGGAAPGAEAATTCTHAVPGLLEVYMSAHRDSAHLRTAGSSIGVLGRDGPVACAGAATTTSSVDTVLVVDESDDPDTAAVNDGRTMVAIAEPASFGPGMTAEAGGVSEIEFLVDPKGGFDQLVAGGIGAQQLIAGNDGLAWSTDGDADMLGMPFDGVMLFGDAAQDFLNAQGGHGTGAALTTATTLRMDGGGGNDTLAGSNATIGDVLLGGAGDDRLMGYNGADLIQPAPGDDTLQGGLGDDTVDFDNADVAITVDLANVQSQDTGEGRDSIAEVEHVSGSFYNDSLSGDAAANVLDGGDGGDDTLEGRGGADELRGGNGSDTVSHASSPVAMTVDLSRTLQPGEGDRLFSVEAVIGSAFADTLTGNSEGNRIEGGAGADTVSAGDGPDMVRVRDGDGDRVTCGAGADSAISDRLTLDALDADCETVEALPEPPGSGDRPAGSGDQPGEGPDAAAADDTLSFALSAARRQRVLRGRGIRIQLHCPREPCTATTGGTAVLRRGDSTRSLRLRLRPLTASVAAGTTRSVRLRLTRRQLGALRSALIAGQRPMFTLTARARDAAGNVVVRTIRVRSAR